MDFILFLNLNNSYTMLYSYSINNNVKISRLNEFPRHESHRKINHKFELNSNLKLIR